MPSTRPAAGAITGLEASHGSWPLPAPLLHSTNSTKTPAPACSGAAKFNIPRPMAPTRSPAARWAWLWLSDGPHKGKAPSNPPGPAAPAPRPGRD